MSIISELRNLKLVDYLEFTVRPCLKKTLFLPFKLISQTAPTLPPNLCSYFNYLRPLKVSLGQGPNCVLYFCDFFIVNFLNIFYSSGPWRSGLLCRVGVRVPLLEGVVSL